MWPRGRGAVFTVVWVGAGQGRSVGDPGGGVDRPHRLSWTRKRSQRDDDDAPLMPFDQNHRYIGLISKI